MSIALERSYQHCRQVARERARNFYYGFWLLPKPRRDAFCAVYAFMRYCDDVADGAGGTPEKAARLQQWRQALERALGGGYGDSPILPAFHDAVLRYQIPAEYLYQLLAGTEMDLSIRCYQSFEELYQYCYHVASVVGLCALYMMGFRDPDAKLLAERCGVAFQLTNILRDLGEDAARGRIYLPLEDFERFGYSPQQLVNGIDNGGFRELMRYEIRRARSYYEEAAPLIWMVEPESRPALWTLISIYRGVLGIIERRIEGRASPDAGGSGAAAFAVRATLSDKQKIGLVLRAAAMQLQLRVGGKPDWRLRA